MKPISIDLLGFQDQLKVKKEDDKTYLFDPIRKKYIVIGPEEIVRQLMIQYLIAIEHIPLNKIAVEKEMRVNNRRKRFDILIFDTEFQPRILIECKAPSVAINQSVARQAAVYNLALQVDYLLLTNGRASYLFKMNYEEKSWEGMEEFPEEVFG